MSAKLRKFIPKAKPLPRSAPLDGSYTDAVDQRALRIGCSPIELHALRQLAQRWWGRKQSANAAAAARLLVRMAILHADELAGAWERRRRYLEAEGFEGLAWLADHERRIEAAYGRRPADGRARGAGKA